MATVTMNSAAKNYRTVIGLSPKNYDLAIVSINNKGTSGALNKYVQEEFNYKIFGIDKKSLKKGFYLQRTTEKKSILYIVTVDNNETDNNLKRNLANALLENQEFLVSKSIWLPLMGTGSGGLSFIESYKITIDVITKFASLFFTIAIPDDNRGRNFYSQFSSEMDSVKAEDENSNKNPIEKNYFLAGHIWSGEDQIERFISNNIWVNGHDTNDTRAVNSVKKGDLVILKSTYANKSVSYLRIKATGIVTRNLEDGHKLEISWDNVLKEPIDIPGLGKYRRTFARLMPDDINIVLEKIQGQKSFLKRKTSVDENIENVVNSTTIAGLISDVDSGADYLDIDKDINAFARVISAKSFNPPLAIALLGKWGSGKSFFMRKLKERIQVLSQNSSTQNIYCNGIAHVHFNAWSYMDSNLWAGIITRIFEGLQEYICNDSLASKNIKEIEEALTKKLNIAQNELIDLANQKQAIDKRILNLKSQKKSTKHALNEKIKEIKTSSIKDVLNNLNSEFQIETKVAKTLLENKSFNQSSDRFNEIVPREYWQDPTELYKRIKSKYTFLKTFFKGANWQKSLGWFCIIIIVIISMKGIMFLLIPYTGIINFTFPSKLWYFISISAAFIFRTYKTVKHLQPLISTFWKIKEDYELDKKNALFKFKQLEKAWKLEIENYQTEITTINEQINQAKEFKSEIEYRLENTLTTEALYKFIEKRSTSDDYQKHLGIVSVIRKDFEILSELFVAHNLEADKQKESEEFKKRFASPLQRIILYIDDLDRCSEERVVQVLEAVNLLMAYPLFIVVVGVDPRWVKNALIKKHQFQLSSDGNSQYDALEMTAPSNYLEKIFQIPFNLKAATETNVKHMLKTLAESLPEIESINSKLLLNEERALADTFDKVDEKFKKNQDIAEQQPKEELNAPQTKNIESLKFTEQEIQLIQDMSEVLGKSPRTLKRFINIYRIIKAHEDFTYIMKEEDGEILAVMFLIALPIGKYKKINSSFNKFIKDLNDYSMLSHFLSCRLSDIEPIKECSITDDHEMRINLYEKLTKQDSVLLVQPRKVFLKHHQFIKRFTFNLN
ncbi:P-loop NTPase fold protein [Zobellia uliginosa]|uniref:P-loop NTPase fold protein n=1 Tax=Zobellia uliginosa TaxID=143224 RepID=UPI001C07B691|nr:P-loop NTPase fold protein [Zobellia uliginosa]MBU2945803.1 KAP family NTPase [Zobellia uliginosa]